MWLFSTPGLQRVIIVICLVAYCRGGVIPAMIAGGVAAPAAFMLFKAIANGAKEPSSRSITSTTTTTTTTTTTPDTPAFSSDYMNYDRNDGYRQREWYDRERNFNYFNDRQRHYPSMRESPYRQDRHNYDYRQYGPQGSPPPSSEFSPSPLASANVYN
ncbi:hypothetical protein BIW11_07272, partial [Tropilaelaps mercedesae]